MEHNGFRCEPAPDGAVALRYDASSGARLGIVRRRLQTSFEVRDRRASAVQSSTGLVGP